MALRAAAAAAALAVSAAQFQLTGQWQVITPAPGSVVPTGTFFAHPATTAGCFITASTDANGANSTFSFDPATQMWSELPLPASPQPLQPLLVTFGGFLIRFGSGLLDDLSTMSLIDSAVGPSTSWADFTLQPSAPVYGFRNGARVTLVSAAVLSLLRLWTTKRRGVDRGATRQRCGAACGCHGSGGLIPVVVCASCVLTIVRHPAPAPCFASLRCVVPLCLRSSYSPLCSSAASSIASAAAT